jgi:hypothetical protein
MEWPPHLKLSAVFIINPDKEILHDDTYRQPAVSGDIFPGPTDTAIDQTIDEA